MAHKPFGAIAATALAGILSSSVALADTHGKGNPKESDKAGKSKGTEKVAGVCKSNSCAGHVAGGKNECAGHVVEGIASKDQCEKDGKGTWSTGAAK